ncbi:hypothetical protein K469DRAFT_688414 [Zopfia rhizophila CBS 207.26]|uniref:DUF7580 domain-containing protein n=1 Tax=Zopfia rhizophila CBS 207.26 TaxID=1314779 RepID=A0A6A6E4L6_9PEZI|nr:hypothetical protein K469DRAFT_688414 [Zopfia rhizophila CBS 207.26]
MAGMEIEMIGNMTEKRNKQFGHHLLLLFDCCFAAQAGRAGSESLGKSELLAAAAMGMMTPMPGERSFTVALIKEILASYKETGVVLVKDVHTQLVKRKARLHATPIHINLRPGKRSIQLERLPDKNTSKDNTTLHGPYIPLVLKTKEDIGRLNIDSFVRWLGEDRPRDILSVQVLETTSHIQGFVRSVDTKGTPLAKAVNDTALDSIMKAWDNVSRIIDQCSSTQRSSRHDISALRAHAEDLLENLDSMNHEFVDTLERGVITANSSEELQTLDDAIDDPISDALGVVDALRLRQIVYSTGKAQTGLVEDGNTTYTGTSLQEEKRYDWYFSEQEKEVLRARIRHLAVLLSAPKDVGFQSLRCHRCEHKVFKSRYILHFEVPPAYDVSERSPLPLTTIIESAKGSARPTLDERLRIAYLLAKAVHKWHSTGWVHQGISSPNIRFFRFKDSGHIDFSRPFLLGFDFARPDSDPSIGRPTNDPYFDVYRHPARQGRARQGHRKIHDYYSLGVVLLEIGLWQSAVKIVSRTGKDLNPASVRDLLQTESTERLGHYAGALYQKAVNDCLLSRFDDDLDNKNETRALNEFYEKVVKKIRSGIVVR